MKILSKASEYGLRALMSMVIKTKDQQFVSIRELSDELDISFQFLTKILQSLNQAQIIVSSKGPKGGVAFKYSPDKILLSEVIKVLEGEDFFDKCIIGLPDCGEAVPCPMHEIWKEIKESLKDKLEHTNVAEMGINIEEGKIRLRP
ncbi:MAG TPA: Rrf2 family transcriptional regulator [Saprospiraceae bacterium]|nr:Rrf2 family transcriptional regulator [Saprospiraceae bacterium]HQW55197.1 Rrf2 family transcriptional regulator [Saprospiraceae bacterium]